MPHSGLCPLLASSLREPNVCPDRSSAPPDSELVARFKHGDEAAFGLLYERHRAVVYRVAHRILRNEEDSLDIVQEAFLSAHRALRGFEGRAKLSTWLCQIAVNRAIDRCRKKRARGLESYESHAADSKLTRGRAGGSEPNDPVAKAMTEELSSRLTEALETLSDKHREVFVLYTLQGLSYRDIATELEVSMGTVMSRLFYARKCLQGLLAGFASSKEAL
jgi:RNA polymerase sigma-70 factor, ECF subfamily